MLYSVLKYLVWCHAGQNFYLKPILDLQIVSIMHEQQFSRSALEFSKTSPVSLFLNCVYSCSQQMKNMANT